MCAPADMRRTFNRLSGEIDRDAAATYLKALSEEYYDGRMPDALLDVIAPLWSPLTPRPRHLFYALQSTANGEHRRIFEQPGLVTEEERPMLYQGRWRDKAPAIAPRLPAAYLIGGHIEWG